MKNQKQKNKGFTKAPNEFLWNPELTLEEKALLIILKSNNEDWKTRITEIYSRSLDKDFSQRNVVKSLIEKGYLIKQKIKTGKKGTFDYVYNFSFKGGLNGIIKSNQQQPSQPESTDSAFPGEGNPDVGNPGMENPQVENPQVEKLTSETPSMVNLDLNNTNTNNTNTDNTNSNQTKELKISKSNTEIPESTPKEAGFNAPTKEEVIAFFEQEGSNAKAALAFFDEFNPRNWVTVKGEQLVNWKGMARKTMPKLNAANFELSADMKTQVNGVSKGLYNKLYQKIGAQCQLDGDYTRLNFTESNVRACLYAFCVKHLINDYNVFCEKIRVCSPSLSSFKEFKEGLGVNTDKNSTGTRYA